MKKNVLVGLYLSTVITLILGCAEEKPVQPVSKNPMLSEANVPKVLWTETIEDFLISVSVFDPQGLDDVNTVTLNVYRPHFTTTEIAFQTVLNDSAVSGDLIAFDGIYSRQINSSFTKDHPGDYQFVLLTTDNEGHDSNTITIEVPAFACTKNEKPEIGEIVLPETLSVDPSVIYSFSVEVFDNQGISDIQALIFRIHSSENPTVIEVDTLYEHRNGFFTHTFTSAFADSVMGVYPLSFQAFDRSSASTELIRRDVPVVFDTNGPPYIFNLSAPDTFDLSSETKSFLITLEVIDPQGLSDIDSVYFTSRKPDGTLANQGLPILLVDDGTYGDENPGDGIFSFEARLLDPTAQRGDYTYTFIAVDRKGLKSNIIIHILTII